MRKEVRRLFVTMSALVVSALVAVSPASSVSSTGCTECLGDCPQSSMDARSACENLCGMADAEWECSTSGMCDGNTMLHCWVVDPD